MRPVGAGSATPRSDAEIFARSAMSGLNTAAPATTVNRTHRVVRERARTLQANRSRMRGLMLPLLLSSALMIMLFSAFWVMLDQYEIVASETPEHTHHFFLLLLWFLPVSVAMLAMVWYRRARNQSDAEAAR